MTERSFFHNIRFVEITDNTHHIISATLKELETLPGIGPKLAQAIIDGRPYKEVEDLLKVKGIGKNKLAKIKDLVEAKLLKKKEAQQEETKKKESKKESEKRKEITIDEKESKTS